MRTLLALFALLSLTSCLPEEDPVPSLHDIALYSNASDLRGLYGYFYGPPGTLSISGQEVALSEPSTDEPAEDALKTPLAVPSALRVNGSPYLQIPLDNLSPPPTRVQRIPLTSDVQLEVGVGSQAREVVYFDGRKWFTLATDPDPTRRARIVPRERIGALSGLGELTPDEAAMLEGVLAERAPVAVTLLPEDRVPTRRVGGVPEYRRTALYVQQTVPTDDSAYTPPPQELLWNVVAEGNQALSAEQPSFQIVRSRADLAEVWNKAYGSRLTPPPLPDINFRRETVVAAFLATQPTGGYALEVRDVSLEEGEAYVNVEVIEPEAGAITTQALTTPWVLVRIVREGLNAAWFRDRTTNQLLGVAQ